MPAHSRRRGKDGRDTVVGSNFVVLSSCGFYSEERKGSQSIAGLWTFPCLLLRACPSASAGPGGAYSLAVSTGLSEGSAAVSCAAQTCHGFLFFLSFQFLCNHAGPRRGQRSRGAASRCRFQGGERGLTPAARPFPRLPAPRPPARPPPLCRPHPARQVSEPWMRARALLMDTTDGAWKSAEWASATGHFLGPNKSLQISQQKSQRSQRESVICHLPRVCVGVAALPCSSSPAPEPTRRRSPASPPAQRHPAARPTHGGAGATAVVLGAPPQLVPPSSQTPGQANCQGLGRKGEIFY